MPDAGRRPGHAHHERERAPAHLVARAALHEQCVAHDRAAVADAADHAAHRGHPDVRARRADAEAERHQRERRPVRASDAETLDDGAAPRRCRPRGLLRSLRTAARSRSRRACSVFCARNTSLTVIAPLPIAADAPADQHGEQRTRREDDGEAVLQIGPVAAGQRDRALQQPGGDPRDEHRRDEERHGVDPVRSVRPPRRGEHAAEQRPDRPGRVLHGLEERVRVAEQLVGDEVRHARVDRGTEEARSRARPRGRARRSSPAFVANGSAAKTAARRRSEAIISLRRSRAGRAAGRA